MSGEAKNQAKTWVAARVVFEAESPDDAADLIADAFLAIGLKGVMVETPDREPGLDWDPAAAPPPDVCSVTGYWVEDDRDRHRRRELEQAMTLLGRRSGIHAAVHYAPVDEEDWAESWKVHFEPERVGGRTVIRPSWRSYEAAAGDVVVEIDPGMAFGTGTHPTTRLCIQLLERWTSPGARVLDVGTGSGVLLCVAAALGAGRMLGVDNDPLAVAVAAENLRKNRVPEDRFTVRAGDLTVGVEGSFDIVTANILTPAILTLIGDVGRLLASGGVVIVSGVLAENAGTVAARMGDTGLAVVDQRAWEDWAALAGRKDG